MKKQAMNAAGLTWIEWRDRVGLSKAVPGSQQCWGHCVSTDWYRNHMDPTGELSNEDMSEAIKKFANKSVGVERFDDVKVDGTDPDNYYDLRIGGIKVDPYYLARLLKITDHELFHAWKKIGWAGIRGNKPKRQDIEEAIAALRRWLELEGDE